jgi:kynureninase
MSSEWTRDCTMAYLNANPLPVAFKWVHRDGGERPVQPAHRSVHGYGKWLRETPYFQGLFELIHDVLCRVEDVGDAEWLAEEIRARLQREEQEKLKF